MAGRVRRGAAQRRTSVSDSENLVAPSSGADEDERGLVRGGGMRSSQSMKSFKELANIRRRQHERTMSSLPELNARTGIWFKNLRGQKLHVRVVAPQEGYKRSAAVYFVHRIGSHANRLAAVKMAHRLTENGVVSVLLDLPGHGYSEGKKGVVDSHRHLLDDVELMIDIFALGNWRVLSDAMLCIPEECADEELLDVISRLPFILLAESTSAPIALQTAIRLTKREDEVPPTFLGVAMVSPCLDMPSLPLLGELAAFFREAERTDGRVSSRKDVFSVPGTLWTPQTINKQVELLEADDMVWKGEPMLLSTYTAIEHMMADMQTSLKEIGFPFLVMHDPLDTLCSESDILKLRKKCSTPEKLLDGRRIDACVGCKHDLLVNAPDEVHPLVVEWLFNLKMDASGRLVDT